MSPPITPFLALLARHRMALLVELVRDQILLPSTCYNYCLLLITIVILSNNFIYPAKVLNTVVL